MSNQVPMNYQLPGRSDLRASDLCLDNKTTAVSMGFPHDFVALDPVRAILSGGLRDRIKA